LWFSQNLYTKIIADDSGVIYAMPFSRDSLVAIDGRSGAILWQVNLPLEQGGGAEGLFVNQNTVFVVNTLNVIAYESKTGEFKWLTKLGYGHVPILSDLDSGAVRIYYGDVLYEIDSNTGKILHKTPKATTIWVSGNVVLQKPSNNYLDAFDNKTNKLLWTKSLSFYVDNMWEPQNINKDILLVGDTRGPSWNSTTGVDALNLQTGEYVWQRPETYLSRIAIDHQSQRGYIVREDFALVTIDLQTGNVLGETSFLTSAIPEQRSLFVSIAFGNGIVVISFGDSEQTFGLSLK
jgi:hypothetical protein